MKLPKARTSEIVENDLESELLIYDLTTNKAYALNATSKIVFKACGARLKFDELKRRHNFTDDLIHLTLGELQKNALLDEHYVSPFAGMNRREVIRKVGLASVIALPVISALVAPSAAHSASVCPPASSNIARGCPAGFTGFYQHSCDPAWNPERDSFCQPFASRCSSRSVRYGGVCTDNPGGGYRSNCVCR